MVTPLTLPRDPSQDPRTLRFMQQVQQILNSLLRSQELIQESVDSFTTSVTMQAILANQIFGK